MAKITSLTTPEAIAACRLVTLSKMLKLEIQGMKRRGRSAYAIVKEELGFKGSKQKVLDQLEAHIKALTILGWM